MKTLKANNKAVIQLESLTDETDQPVDIIIRKVSPRLVGMDASMLIVQRNAMIREAAARAEEGGKDIQSLDPSPYPGTVPRHEYSDPNDPALRLDLIRISEIQIVKSGLVSPSYQEICEAYDADPDSPQQGMGPDFEYILNEITKFSGFHNGTVGGQVMAPEEAERFPEGARTAPGLDGGEVQ